MENGTIKLFENKFEEEIFNTFGEEYGVNFLHAGATEAGWVAIVCAHIPNVKRIAFDMRNRFGLDTRF